jgi:hypothetical protein
MHKVAERVINKCGGARNVARILGISVQAVYKWNTDARVGGCNGLIPHRRQIELMIAAKQHGITLTAHDFFPKGTD